MAIIALLIFTSIIITVVVVELKSDTYNDDIDNTSHIVVKSLKGHQLLTRTEWNGAPPKLHMNITPPVELVIIKHTGGGTCEDFQTCAGKVQTIQGISMSEGSSDIYCNFLIGGDGNIYVGRDWDARNQQRDSTIDIVFMGNFDIVALDKRLVEAAKLLIMKGLKEKKLTPNYKIVCHNQTYSTRSPGVNVFKEVVKWPHYDRGLYMGKSLVS